MPDLARVRAAALDALALLFPVDCAGCGRADRALCDHCGTSLTPAVDSRVLGGTGGVPALEVTFALRYDRLVRRIVLEFKQNGRTGLARALAPAVREAVAAAGAGDAALLVVPVPPGRASRRRRGYDPVGLLLARAGIRPAPALRMLRAAQGQKMLSIDERVQNRASSMRATSIVWGRRVLLVDDVVTTGATLLEAARAVRAAGGEVVAAAALASTPRLHR